MPAYLIGIDPPEQVKEEIIRLKNRVLEVCGEQQQVDEPPHCTFVVNNFTNEEDMSDALRKAVRGIAPFDIEVNGTGYFPPEQSGVYMTYVAMKKSKELAELQKRVVIGTSPFRQGCLLQEYLQKNVPNYKYNGAELNNIKKYGYLYVGGNWTPHISIAILDPDAFEKVGDELTKNDVNYIFPVKEVTLFGYNEKWQPLKTYRLGN